MNVDYKEIQCRYLYGYLIEQGKFDLIELLAKSDRREIHNINVNSRLVSSRAHHNAIVLYLKRNGVEIDYPKGRV